MSVSSTSFADRLTRLETNSIKLYAGDETPRQYKPGNLICSKPKVKKVELSTILMGALFGTLVGYMFKTHVGIEMFFSQSLLTLFGIIRTDHMTAGICLAMIAGPVCALGFQLFSRTKNRLAQFWWAYLAGIIGGNLMTWYYFYLTITGSA